MASLTWQPSFGGLALTAANGIIIEDVQETMLHRAEYRTKLSGDGGLFSRDQVSGRRITISGVVFGSDEGVRRSNESDLVFRTQLGLQNLYLWSDISIPARLDGDIKFGVMRGTQFAAREFKMTFRSEHATWETQTPIVDTTWTWSSAVTTHLLPLDTGDAEPFPTISLTNNGSTISDKSFLFTEISAQKQLSIQGLTLQANQILTIDMWLGRIGDGSAQSPTFASIEGDFFPLPAGAQTSIEFAHNAGTTSIDVSTIWNPRHMAGV